LFLAWPPPLQRQAPAPLPQAVSSLASGPFTLTVPRCFVRATSRCLGRDSGHALVCMLPLSLRYVTYRIWTRQCPRISRFPERFTLEAKVDGRESICRASQLALSGLEPSQVRKKTSDTCVRIPVAPWIDSSLQSTPACATQKPLGGERMAFWTRQYPQAFSKRGSVLEFDNPGTILSPVSDGWYHRHPTRLLESDFSSQFLQFPSASSFSPVEALRCACGCAHPCRCLVPCRIRPWMRQHPRVFRFSERSRLTPSRS